MTRTARIFLTVILVGCVLLTATIGAAVAAVYRAGTVAIEVEEDGHHIDVSVPAGLVGVAVALAPRSVLDEVASELAPFVPALEAGWRQLEAAPDFVLVDARSGDEHVRVLKSGSRLEIAVDAPGARVRVGIPLGTVGSVLHRLERRL